MKILTVTLAISALNEAGNIKPLITSILSQKSIGFVLKKIVLASDGSTDYTVKVAKSIKNPAIEVHSYRSRKGKAVRLQQIYQTVATDLVIQLDADLKIDDPFFLSKLVKPFSNANIAMCGANALPNPTTNYIGRAIAVSTIPYVALRDLSPSLSIGPALAFRSSFAKSIKFPPNIMGEDIFAYFLCLSAGYKYAYSRDAIVHYDLPHSLRDHIAQNSRFLRSPITMKSYFPIELVDSEDYIPFIPYILQMIKTLILHPVSSLLILLINIYCRLQTLLVKDTINGKWVVAKSTKIALH